MVFFCPSLGPVQPQSRFPNSRGAFTFPDDRKKPVTESEVLGPTRPRCRWAPVRGDASSRSFSSAREGTSLGQDHETSPGARQLLCILQCRLVLALLDYIEKHNSLIAQGSAKKEKVRLQGRFFVLVQALPQRCYSSSLAVSLSVACVLHVPLTAMERCAWRGLSKTVMCTIMSRQGVPFCQAAPAPVRSLRSPCPSTVPSASLWTIHVPPMEIPLHMFGSPKHELGSKGSCAPELFLVFFMGECSAGLCETQRVGSN